MTARHSQRAPHSANDLAEMQDAMTRLHEGNLKYKNYRRLVFVTDEKQTKPLFRRSLRGFIDGRSTQSSERRNAFTLNPGQGDSIVMLDSGEIAIQIGNHGNQFRTLTLDTTSSDDFSKIQTVMRKWATMPSNVRPLGARRDEVN